MSEKTAKKLRQALRRINIDFESDQYFRDPKTGSIHASKGRKQLKFAKRKARELRQSHKLKV